MRSEDTASGEQAANPKEASLKTLEADRAMGTEETRKRVVDETINMISDTHRRLAAMMRATAPGAPHRLESDGLINAISTMLEQDFQHAFDEINWCVSDETAERIDEVISPAIAELILAAVQEALRNAARHARGADVHRHLRLTFNAIWNLADANLEVIVADDGVGIASADSSTTGTGGGLLTHSTLLAKHAGRGGDGEDCATGWGAVMRLRRSHTERSIYGDGNISLDIWHKNAYAGGGCRNRIVACERVATLRLAREG